MLVSEGPIARIITFLPVSPPERINPPIITLSPVPTSPRVEMFNGLPASGVGDGVGVGLGVGVGSPVGVGVTPGGIVGVGGVVGLGVGPFRNSPVALMKGRPTPPAIMIRPSFSWVAL